MSSEIKLLDVVALLRPVPDAGLVLGQVGTIVEILKDAAYEVEFCDDDGKAYAILAVKKEDLIVLHYSRIEAA